MNIIGKKVEHVKFGRGIIVKQYDNKLEVAFGGDVKCFSYPGVFEEHIRALDAQTVKYINQELENMEEVRQKTLQEKRNRMQRIAIMALPCSHGIFDIKEDEAADFIDNWELSTGRSNIKKENEEVILPKRLNMNSACIVTMRERGRREGERRIFALLMPKDNFIGTNCKDGIITAHDQYRILFDPEEPIYFWDMFPEDKRLKNWGSRKMKYTTAGTVEGIFNQLEDMDIEDELKKELQEFDHYCNDITY